MRATSLAVLLFLYVFPLRADWNTKQYQEMKRSRDPAVRVALEEHIQGLGEGMAFANADLQYSRGPQARLYCAPSGLPMGAQLYMDVLDAQIERAKLTKSAAVIEKTYLGVLLLTGLEHTFPCH
jgi:hypothetical protein